MVHASPSYKIYIIIIDFHLLCDSLVRYLPVSLERGLVLTPWSDSILPRHMMSANSTVWNVQCYRLYISGEWPKQSKRNNCIILTFPLSGFHGEHKQMLWRHADNRWNKYDHFKATANEKGLFPWTFTLENKGSTTACSGMSFGC